MADSIKEVPEPENDVFTEAFEKMNRQAKLYDDMKKADESGTNTYSKINQAEIKKMSKGEQIMKMLKEKKEKKKND